LPGDLSEIEGVVSLGGPMNVYEEKEFPFLKEEDIFIKEAVKKEIPFLGICLGSQLIAKACGARVRKSPVKEVGWFKVALEPTVEDDPLFEGLAGSLEVFQWHEDTFDIPSGGVLLAKGGDCPHQAFRIGRSVYGIQFHIEVTERIIADWC
jgi:GMP synthase-like glutamine amidotransferase